MNLPLAFLNAIWQLTWHVALDRAIYLLHSKRNESGAFLDRFQFTWKAYRTDLLIPIVLSSAYHNSRNLTLLHNDERKAKKLIAKSKGTLHNSEALNFSLDSNDLNDSNLIALQRRENNKNNKSNKNNNNNNKRKVLLFQFKRTPTNSNNKPSNRADLILNTFNCIY